MQVNLESIDFKEIFSAAIVDKLDKESKDTLIKQALHYLLTPSAYGYGRLTPMQEAYNNALRYKAEEYVKEFIDSDTSIKETIKGIITDAVNKIMTDNREKTVSKVAEKIIEGLYNSN